MTFRLQSIVWSLLVWGEIFAYTLLTLDSRTEIQRTVPIVALFCTLLAFILFIVHKSKEFKTILLFACWGLVVVLILFLRIWSIVDAAFLNIYIAVTAILTSIVWCVVSHSTTVSDPAWHWYVWFTIVLIAVCGACHNQNNLAEQIYILNTVLLLVLQFIYAWYTLKHQAAGQIRCKHLWRLSAGTTLASTLLVGSILQRIALISYLDWELLVVSVEIAAAVCIGIDGIVGFQHQGINYEEVSTNDLDP